MKRTPFLLPACERAPVAVSEESGCDYCRGGVIIAPVDRFMFALDRIREQKRLGNCDVCSEIEGMRINE